MDNNGKLLEVAGLRTWFPVKSGLFGKAAGHVLSGFFRRRFFSLAESLEVASAI